MSLDVLYEDNHLLVVNKPAGLATMGDAGRPTLHGLATEYIRQKYNKPHGVYVGIVSRLDAMTSGVIVLARTSKAAARLNKQFSAKSQTGGRSTSQNASPSGQSRGLRKSYLAVVRPQPNATDLPSSGRWVDWIYKDDAAHRMRISPHARDDAKIGELAFEVVRRTDRFCVVSVTPITGRKHQIRLQFSSRDWPVVGDRKYDSNSEWPVGIALHSHRLTLDHPTLRESMTFQCEPPATWDRALKSKTTNP